MEFMTELTEVPWKKTAIAIGKFEGLHRGHQTLIKQIVEKQQEGFVPVAFTFEQSPRNYFGKGTGMLFTKEERRNLFRQWKIACLLECPFTRELASMEAQEFIESILMDKLHVGYLAVGQDFCFGKARRGNIELLQHYQAQGAFQLQIMEKKCWNLQPISSTFIREQLALGQLSMVNSLLGFPFFIEGNVVEGNRLGRTWGIPTANIIVDSMKLLPPNGVYFSKVILEGRSYRAITNLGTKPTIGEDYAKGAESYLYDFQEDIYGKKIHVELLHFHRKEQKFASLEQLVEQLKWDIEVGQQYFSTGLQ